MPNSIAYAALILWPIITIIIFAIVRQPKAIIWSLLAGYLFLPVKTSFDFPGIPAFDKTTVANLSTCLAAVAFFGSRSVRLPREWWLLGLFALYLTAPMMTVFTNGDALLFGPVFLPGLVPYDALSEAAYKAIDLIPLLLGYNLLRHPRMQVEFLKALALACLGYSLLMLVEIRLSPQLHTWVYGFFPHSFGQQMRADGFRPVVFLGHGLVVAIFTAMAITAAASLARQRVPVFGVSSRLSLGYLFFVLVLCKSLGALLLAVGATVLILFGNRRMLRISCAIAALVVLSYPALRGANLIPVQAMAEQVAGYDKERAGSFQTRIDNENQLLERARLRPWFGWGGYGRNRVRNAETGKDLSITDGTWIILVGMGGWVGYIATFGLLCIPLIVAGRSQHKIPMSTQLVSLVFVVNLLDLIPNSSLGPATWLMAGMVISLPRSIVRDSMKGTGGPRIDIPQKTNTIGLPA